MNRRRATKILRERGALQDDGLFLNGWYLAWSLGEERACLDGYFTAEDLEAIAWWMRNKDKSMEGK